MTDDSRSVTSKERTLVERLDRILCDPYVANRAMARTIREARDVLSANPSAPETKALQVPAAHRAGTEPLSRLAGDVEWCMAKINPDSDVYAVLHGVQVALRGAEQEAAKDDECCCAEAGGGLVCTLPKNHAGRHEAWGTRKNLLQAWSAQETNCDGATPVRASTAEVVLPLSAEPAASPVHPSICPTGDYPCLGATETTDRMVRGYCIYCGSPVVNGRTDGG